MENELKILEQISHPDIVTIFELLEDDTNYYIVSELIKHDNLEQLLNTRKRKTGNNFKEDEVCLMSYQIFRALNFMHSQNLVHRDLKPQNIMVANPETLELKITDFGFATFFDEQNKLDT